MTIPVRRHTITDHDTYAITGFTSHSSPPDHGLYLYEDDAYLVPDLHENLILLSKEQRGTLKKVMDTHPDENSGVTDIIVHGSSELWITNEYTLHKTTSESEYLDFTTTFLNRVINHFSNQI